MAEDFTTEIREVWSDNLAEEFDKIKDCIDDFPFVAMDTEFPGIIYGDTRGDVRLSLVSRYSFLKQNVDALKLIQLGLTLADSQGNLPHFGDSNVGCVWQFNFMDFDIDKDPYWPQSVELLKENGIEFDKFRSKGVEAFKFAELLMTSGLVCNVDSVTWITFHCCYDFGYLVKVLTDSPLPSNYSDFEALMKAYFGEKVFDVKHIIKFCNGLWGGLNYLVDTLGVKRVGTKHQAGSDSLVTLLVFRKILERNFIEEGSIDKYAGVYGGLEPDSF